MLELDGSAGEGGGQILRSALTLSLLTGQAFRLTRIRARRSVPGLRPQHLQAVRAAAEIAAAETSGAELGSQALVFSPGEVRAGDYRFDIGTAGATSLVLQTIQLPLSRQDTASTVTLVGGTHVPFSPCFHYLALQWAPMLARLGIALDLSLELAGFYPRGGGVVHARIHPARRVAPLRLPARGALRALRCISASARLPAHVAQRQAHQARQRLAHLRAPWEETIDSLEAPSPGSMLLVQATFEQGQACFFALGEPGKPAEQVADEAADELLGFLAGDGAVDRYLADQLLLPLAVADGVSVLRTGQVTQHLITNAEVVRRFVPLQLEIAGALGGPGLITVSLA